MTDHSSNNRVVIRGAGEMASGVIRRLVMAGYDVIALEQPTPSCIRRLVCFAEAVREKCITIEGVSGEFAGSVEEAYNISAQKRVPILIDPIAETLSSLKPLALIDGRLLKKDIDTTLDMAPVVIGLGPGFTVGENCHAAVETNRGADLGRVIYDGSPQTDTGEPAKVSGVSYNRVLRSPADGEFISEMKLAEIVSAGQTLGHVAGIPVVGQIDGIIRGLIRGGSTVSVEQKIGDIDPRGIKDHCCRISNKANAIGNGTLEAILALKSHMADSADSSD